MKTIESVKIVLADPGHPAATKVIAKIQGENGETEDVDLTALALVRWPIDIRIDGRGATVTLRMRASEIETKCGKVHLDPVPEKTAAPDEASTER